MSTETKTPGPDPITTEIVFNALQSVADESFVALMKSAYSTNIKERHDHPTIRTSPAAPICPTSTSRRLCSSTAASSPFVCNIAHHADIGGMAAGSMSGGMTEIFQEGLRIPVTRIGQKDAINQEILDLFLLNARAPRERRGDYYAQIAAAKLGVRRMTALGRRYGVARLLAGFSQLLERSATRMADALRLIPDGTYSFRDCMDDDGVATEDVLFALRIEAKDGPPGVRLRRDGAADRRQHQSHPERDALGGHLRAESAARSGGAEYAVGHRLRRDHRARRQHRQCGVSGLRRRTGAHLPAGDRRRHGRACAGAARPRAGRAQRREHHGRLLRRRSPLEGGLCLPGDDRRRRRRPADQARQGRRADRHHQHLQPAGRGDRDRVPADGAGIRPRPRFRRRRQASGRPRHPSGS